MPCTACIWQITCSESTKYPPGKAWNLQAPAPGMHSPHRQWPAEHIWSQIGRLQHSVLDADAYPFSDHLLTVLKKSVPEGKTRQVQRESFPCGVWVCGPLEMQGVHAHALHYDPLRRESTRSCRSNIHCAGWRIGDCSLGRRLNCVAGSAQLFPMLAWQARIRFAIFPFKTARSGDHQVCIKICMVRHTYLVVCHPHISESNRSVGDTRCLNRKTCRT